MVATYASRHEGPRAASCTISANPAKTATALTFDASASKDTDGSIAKYEWDLDGDGTFETTTTSSKVTHSYAAEGTWYYEILAPGYKYNMPDVLAAIGNTPQQRLTRETLV